MINLSDEQIQYLINEFNILEEKFKIDPKEKFSRLITIDLNGESSFSKHTSDFKHVLTAFKTSKSRKEQAVLCVLGRMNGIPEFYYSKDRTARLKALGRL